MYHLHRRAYHTQLRPPLTVLTDSNNDKVFKVFLTNGTVVPQSFAHQKKNYEPTMSARPSVPLYTCVCEYARSLATGTTFFQTE